MMHGSVRDSKVVGQDKSSEKIVVGRIAGVYGVKGWVKVFSYTDPMESIVDYKPWFIRAENKKNAPWTRITLEAGKRHAKTVVARLEHCADRDQALTYVGNEIAIELQQLEALKRKNEYYWRDLIGLRVINQQAIELGSVKNLMETGANDVLVVVSDIKAESGETIKLRERLIPWTMHRAIIGVDLEKKVIEVDWDADF
ncbi:MAG: ribosome maturation factor RimM [Gammaproteobacteria bacterium]|nr:ribosome maturation factor RimM [Gammaproteobacteria bacterium]